MTAGVWKSVDGGATWTPAGDLGPFVEEVVVSSIPGRLYADRIDNLKIDPEDPSRLYAATSRGVWTLVEED